MYAKRIIISIDFDLGAQLFTQGVEWHALAIDLYKKYCNILFFWHFKYLIIAWKWFFAARMMYHYLKPRLLSALLIGSKYFSECSIETAVNSSKLDEREVNTENKNRCWTLLWKNSTIKSNLVSAGFYNTKLEQVIHIFLSLYFKKLNSFHLTGVDAIRVSFIVNWGLKALFPW